ncbi:MAG: hypothetical protein QME58_06450 [Bacteroidota bacterium]|nr:hypothetical protein [Bacteroidota bacterium]
MKQTIMEIGFQVQDTFPRCGLWNKSESVVLGWVTIGLDSIRRWTDYVLVERIGSRFIGRENQPKTSKLICLH